MAITATGKTRIFWQFTEAVIIMYTWATVGKTKDIRKPSAVKIARSDFTERGERLYSPSTLPKTLPRCGFSPVQVGQKWAIEQLNNIASTTTKFGWQTSNLRKHLGLSKQKLNKKEAIPATHAVDGITLAASQFIDYLPLENFQGRGHCWQGQVEITNALFFVIRRPPISRRQLHLMLPSKGGLRRKYGGTTTRHNIRKGDYVEAEKAGIKYQGWCSGDTAKQVSVSNSTWKRIGQFTASKVRLLRRSTNLICTQERNFNVAV